MLNLRTNFAATIVLLTSASILAAPAEVPQQDLDRIRAAAPSNAPAMPKTPRKVLVFSKALGYYHTSIPWGQAALRILGEKTGAYAATVSDDPTMFDRPRLAEFDAVVFNNICGNPIPEPQRRANVLEFVRSGRGLAGIHCAAHVDWPEYEAMLGGYSLSHPWATVTIRVEEPGHPLARCFTAAPFPFSDEIYIFRNFSRQKSRVLLSIDVARTDMNKKGVPDKAGDYPLAWLHRYGQGRVFYCGLGHVNEVFWNPAVLQHYLAGIQFALGDLEADATPRVAK